MRRITMTVEAWPMSSETAPASAAALALLPVPFAVGLSEQQVRGITCVWDGIALSPATAMDLGARTVYRLGEARQWYPRACRRCAAKYAMEALRLHSPGCEECVGDYAQCETGLDLVRLTAEARR
ncbi:hypothetical protein [Streptomyces sp. NPDC086787]|uniref:hypothetical protein n=1 Tax=Streptomyces sp. NPDC086787 TaxID=3365759 RepID=UPI0038199663